MDDPVQPCLPMNVIFLDVDGVLNNLGSFIGECAKGEKWCSTSVGLIRKLCLTANARIVVSSTWRGRHTADELKAEWPQYGGAGLVEFIIGRTPQPEEMAKQTDHCRGREIEHWLTANPSANYCIIDDDSDMLPSQAEHFVKTQFKTGFQIAGYVNALRIFGIPDTGLEWHLSKAAEAI